MLGAASVLRVRRVKLLTNPQFVSVKGIKGTTTKADAEK
jgi:hypothetical protein